jgi:uncharacterized RDD family membrane protein YckC
VSYPAPSGAAQFYSPVSGAPAYAHWIKRVGAALVDALTLAPFWILIVVVALVTHSSHTVNMGTSADGTPATVEVSDGISGIGFTLIGLLYVLALAFALWNVVFRQGRTGYSLGKSALGIKLVMDGSDQPVGAGRTFLRQLAHILDSFCYVGYLWPLWDAKRQTFADKLCTTVVLEEPTH